MMIHYYTCSLTRIERKLRDARSALEALSRNRCWGAVENTNDYIDRLVKERARLLVAQASADGATR